MLFSEADVVHRYTRADAIADGVLIDLTAPGTKTAADCAEAGIRYPLAITAAAHAQVIALTPAARRMLNDETGRLWDVLTMLKDAIRRSAPGHSELRFRVLAVVKSVRPSLVTLKCVCGPDDDGAPCLTLMMSDED